MDKIQIKFKLQNSDFSTNQFFEILIDALNNKDDEIISWCGFYDKIPVPSKFKNKLFKAKINYQSKN